MVTIKERSILGEKTFLVKEESTVPLSRFSALQFIVKEDNNLCVLKAQSKYSKTAGNIEDLALKKPGSEKVPSRHLTVIINQVAT